MDAAGNAPRLHVVGGGDVIGPDVELPFAQAQNAAEHVSRVDANAHVDGHVGSRAHLTDFGDHQKSHAHAVGGVVGARDRKSAHAVITIAEDFDSQTMVLLRESVETGE